MVWLGGGGIKVSGDSARFGLVEEVVKSMRSGWVEEVLRWAVVADWDDLVELVR